MPDVVIAHVTPPLPVSAFVAGVRALQHLLPEGTPENALLVRSDDDNKGGFTLQVAVDVDVDGYFSSGHFELRWVDT